MSSGILLLSKPAGPSSARVLGPLKRVFGTKKIGHTGTLDPFASGLLVLMVGRATRIAPWFTALDKEYEATVRFGEETDTLDPEGTVIKTASPPTEVEINKIIPRFVGTIRQIPPAYSAVHVQGKRAYQRARDGESVDIPPRTVHVHRLSMEYLDRDLYRMRVACGSGTYIRSLARDIAHAAGSVASLETLHRRAVGPFRDEDATSTELLEQTETPDTSLIPIPDALRTLGTVREVTVAHHFEDLVLSGVKLSSEALKPLARVLEEEHTSLVDGGTHETDTVPTILLVNERGRELALCQYSAGSWKYRAVFATPS